MTDQRDGGIAWTEETWNPVRGCTRISPGCVRCYAEKVAARFSGPGLPYEGLAKMTKDGARWTGKVVEVEDHVTDPLRWTRPRTVFVNSMSDLFHEGFTDSQIARVFAVMYLSPQHTFQVLTKRAKRMRETLNSPGFYRLVLDHADFFRSAFPRKDLARIGISDPTKFPHRNVWLGVSVESQKYADERMPELIATPAAVRWVSVEPQIGHVALRPWLDIDHDHGIDWVVVGGESGEGSRPFDLGWARSILAERESASPGTAIFVKQMGANPHDEGIALELENSKGGDMAEWPEDLRVREFPQVMP